MQRLSTVKKWYLLLYDRGWTENRSQSCEYVRLDLDFLDLRAYYLPRETSVWRNGPLLACGS